MKKAMKIILLIIIINNTVFAQGYNKDKTSLTNFVKRMYKSAPFEGVRVIEDYDNKYIISVLSLEKAKYTSNSIMTRIADTKSKRQVSTFFNGSDITSDFIIKTTEEKIDSTEVKTTIETIESIKENSVGFVNGLELMTNFDIEEGKRKLFIYYKKL